jgi:GxxExxY protein
MTYRVDELCHEIIGASIEVHKLFGPGLLERIYSQCLCRELTLRGLSYQTEVPIPLLYKDTVLDTVYKADLIVEDTVIVELKSVVEMNPLFEAQLISYLTLSKKPTGLLINFNVPVLKNGIKRLFPKQVS